MINSDYLKNLIDMSLAKSKQKNDFVGQKNSCFPLSNWVLKRRLEYEKSLNFPMVIRDSVLPDWIKAISTHSLILGATGVGKTLNSIYRESLVSIVSAKFHVVLIDPKADLFDDLATTLEVFSCLETKRLTIISPDSLVGFNLIDPKINRNGIFDIPDIFASIMDDEFTPNMKFIFAQLFSAVQLVGGTLFDMQNILLSKTNIQYELLERLEKYWPLSQIEDFKKTVFDANSSSLKGLTSRLALICDSSYLTRLFCSIKNTLDIKSLLESNVPQVFLLKLYGKQEKLNRSQQKVLAQIFLSMVTSIVMKREKGLMPVQIFIDEFQHMADSELLTYILREGRSKGVFLSLASQSFNYNRGLKEAILDNVSIFQIFNTGPTNNRSMDELIDLKSRKIIHKGQELDRFSSFPRFVCLIRLRSDDPSLNGVCFLQDFSKFDTSKYSAGLLPFSVESKMPKIEKSEIQILKGVESSLPKGFSPKFEFAKKHKLFPKKSNENSKNTKENESTKGFDEMY